MSTDKAMVTDCDCTKVAQDETCPVGYPSLLCEVCDGKGVIPAALAQAGQPVAVITEEMIQFAIQYGPRCRDCADNGPVCPGSGLPCGGREKALRFMAEAINYGLKHRFISALAHPPAKREAGETAVPVSNVRVWQDMATAPLNGRHCILAVQEDCFIYAVQGAYDGKQWNAVHREDVKPLCWMPNVRLPAEFLPAGFVGSLATTEGSDNG